MSKSNKKILQRIEDAVSAGDNLQLITINKDFTLEQRLKRSLCKHFILYAFEKKMMLKDLSKMTGIPTTRLSEITNYKIEKFTVDQLIKNLSILAEHEPRIHEYLLFLEEAAKLPTMKVSETRRLKKTISDASKAAHAS